LINPQEIQPRIPRAPGAERHPYITNPDLWKGHLIRPINKGGFFDTTTFNDLAKKLQYLPGFLGFDEQSPFFYAEQFFEYSRMRLQKEVRQHIAGYTMHDQVHQVLEEYFRVPKNT
jgi:hypothetical protein